MSLAARCPDCKTLNPASAATLQAQGGHLTCGHCGTLFSGVDHLTPADDDSWAREQSAPAENDSTETAGATEPGAPAGKRVWRIPVPGPLQALNRRMATWPRFARRWTFILAALLLLQVMWWQRLAIAVALPFTTPLLSAWSHAMGTDLAGAASSRVRILASSLKSATDNRLQLEVRLRNESRTPSRWPALDLQLLDSKRGTVTSITLRVSDYAVAGEEQPATTLKPGDDAEIIAWIDTSVLNSQTLELPVSGFKVSVVDAPASRRAPSADAHH